MNTNSYKLEVMFFDYKSDLENETKKLFSEADHLETIQRQISFSFLTKSILETNEFLNLEKQLAWVSPANAFGYMSGGIDYYLADMVLPNIDQLVQKRIFEVGEIDNDGKHYLPIGSAVIVQHSQTKQYLVSTPTMLFPSDVRETENAKYAFIAVLKVIDKYNLSQTDDQKKITKVMCPGLATGVGGLSFPKLAQQLKDGWNQFKKELVDGIWKVDHQYPADLTRNSCDVYYENNLMGSQPLSKANHRHFGLPAPPEDSDSDNSDSDNDSDDKKKEFDMSLLGGLDLSELGINDISELDDQSLEWLIEQVSENMS